MGYAIFNCPQKRPRFVNVSGPLIEAFAQVTPNSIQEANKIQTRRRTQPENEENLRLEDFITGDGCVYNVENGKAVLYLTNTALNPILKEDNVADAVRQITETGNYEVKLKDFERIKKRAPTRFVLSDLKLTRSNNEMSFYEINPVSYGRLNTEQRKLAERVHGKGEKFTKAMQMLNTPFKYIGQNTTRIYVLSPKYVQDVARDVPIARVGYLAWFLGASSFFSCSKSVDFDDCLIRGISRDHR
jgi:hypothetical protein